MPQTGILFAAISLGFVIFVTTKGELPAYLACFFGAKPNSTAATSTGAATSSAPAAPSSPSAPTLGGALTPLQNLQPLTSLASDTTGTDSIGSEGVVSV
jgi:hypothetical protein